MSYNFDDKAKGQLSFADPMNRLREYMAESCDDLMRLEGSFQFKKYSWPEVVDLLDKQEKAYKLWKEDQAQLQILAKSLPEPPLWLHSPPKTQPVYRSIRKELINATYKAWDTPDYELTLWEIRQLVKSSAPSPVPGGPRELQQRANYDELLDLCLQDMRDLPEILSADQRADERLYNRAIVRYMIRYFLVYNEEDDGSAIWGQNYVAQRHRRQLGFANEYFDKCRNSPAKRDAKPRFL